MAKKEQERLDFERKLSQMKFSSSNHLSDEANALSSNLKKTGMVDDTVSGSTKHSSFTERRNSSNQVASKKDMMKEDAPAELDDI